MNQQLYEIITSLILAGLLFFPISKMIWVLSVRRLQKKRGQKSLSDQEIQGQMLRARFIAVFLALVFAYAFNHALLGKLHG